MLAEKGVNALFVPIIPWPAQPADGRARGLAEMPCGHFVPIWPCAVGAVAVPRGCARTLAEKGVNALFVPIIPRPAQPADGRHFAQRTLAGARTGERTFAPRAEFLARRSPAKNGLDFFRAGGANSARRCASSARPRSKLTLREGCAWTERSTSCAAG